MAQHTVCEHTVLVHRYSNGHTDSYLGTGTLAQEARLAEVFEGSTSLVSDNGMHAMLWMDGAQVGTLSMVPNGLPCAVAHPGITN